MSWQLASFAVLGLVLVGGFAWYERSRPPSQTVALVAAMAALAAAGRVVFAAIPDVQPTTDIAIFTGYAIGPAPGFAVGALAGLASNFWLGQGPWTPWQMAGWGAAGVFGAVLALGGRRLGRLPLALACAGAGVAYGVLLNFSLMVSYGGEVSLERFLALEARAVPFDSAHAIGNFALALAAGPAMVRMLARFRERFEYRWAPGAAGAAGALLVALLIAAAPAPRAGAAGGPQAAAAWLARQQNGDGGFGGSSGASSDPATTGWAMLGLEAAGRNPLDLKRGANTPVTYLRHNVAELRTPGDLARTILALRGAGVDAGSFSGHDLLRALLQRRRKDGSYFEWPNSTAFAVLALRSAGAGGEAGPSLRWLRHVQNRDGGWGARAGVGSDADSTGAVAQAVRGSASARRAARFLRRAQRRSGGYAVGAGGPVNSQSTAWAVQGLLAAGSSSAANDGISYISAQQAGDGHYRYSSSSDQTPVWVTAQDLAATERQPFPLAAVPRAPTTSGSSTSGGSSTSRGAPPAAGGGKGGAAAQATRGESPSGHAVGSGDGGKAAPGQGSDPATESDPRAPGAAGPASGDGGGGEGPLLPIGIGLGAAALVVGGTWFLARRRAW